MSLTPAQQARADALAAVAELVPYPDDSASPYETLLALAEWILGDEPEPVDTGITEAEWDHVMRADAAGDAHPHPYPEEPLPDWATDQAIKSVEDRDGDEWEREGENKWKWTRGHQLYRDAAKLIAEYAPITPLKES